MARSVRDFQKSYSVLSSKSSAAYERLVNVTRCAESLQHTKAVLIDKIERAYNVQQGQNDIEFNDGVSILEGQLDDIESDLEEAIYDYKNASSDLERILSDVESLERDARCVSDHDRKTANGTQKELGRFNKGNAGASRSLADAKQVSGIADKCRSLLNKYGKYPGFPEFKPYQSPFSGIASVVGGVARTIVGIASFVGKVALTALNVAASVAGAAVSIFSKAGGAIFNGFQKLGSREISKFKASKFRVPSTGYGSRAGFSSRAKIAGVAANKSHSFVESAWEQNKGFQGQIDRKGVAKYNVGGAKGSTSISSFKMNEISQLKSQTKPSRLPKETIWQAIDKSTFKSKSQASETFSVKSKPSRLPSAKVHEAIDAASKVHIKKSNIFDAVGNSVSSANKVKPKPVFNMNTHINNNVGAINRQFGDSGSIDDVITKSWNNFSDWEEKRNRDYEDAHYYHTVMLPQMRAGEIKKQQEHENMMRLRQNNYGNVLSRMDAMRNGNMLGYNGEVAYNNIMSRGQDYLRQAAYNNNRLNFNNYYKF